MTTEPVSGRRAKGQGATMMAARVHRFGGPDVIRYEQVPRPDPGPGEVLVRVAAAGFNPSDAGFRAGVMQDVIPQDLPFTLGSEAAGTVVRTGAGVGRFTIGDHVVGRLDEGGAAAEYLTAPAATLVRAPLRLPLDHAAAIPVAGLTAWQGLFEHARIGPGTRVLVNGAGGGVGMFAVQLARHAGAHVIATAGPRSAERVRAYGAEQIIDYTRLSPHRVLDRPVDLVFNLVPIPPEAAEALCRAVRPGGSLVSITIPVKPRAGTGVTATHFIVRNDPAQLAELITLIDSGTVRVDITAARPLTELPALHRDAEAGRTSGKTILIP
ncbi:NADP-dependent oxidoreductase [Actinoallomurus bryophytorum]|uniref:NADPH:quinone reductase-like Zn-dependent oxidoreductase n=1 Tax=Actinoallomurus bryophytorum TaxID=1490222 RepID=A0A543CS14_9ACTN|nr:NADP-dependent oxidoreductase [Actinoallomurus bryophytorum]TQL99790.1 NADPH:quinone reductase-like Zn-dependent oxidoreductase [Actinoallomurus bryophytorum]